MKSRTSSSSRRWRHANALALATVLVAGCQQQDRAQSEAGESASAESASPESVMAESAMEWARGALQRNPNLELIATDTTTQVFTVRNKHTGEVRAIKLNELAAAPVAALAVDTSDAGQGGASLPDQATASVEEAPAARDSAESTEPRPTTAQSASATTEANANADAQGYTIERNGGQVRVSGPGVSIVSAGGGGSAQGSAGAQQNASEPIICEGPRMVHLDNREIYVEGDAITVRGGCEMHITNSSIVATGTGIVVQDGTVHVSNSHVEGLENSFDADSRAKVFVRASTFKGLPQRSELALVQDQGGNRWR